MPSGYLCGNTKSKIQLVKFEMQFQISDVEFSVMVCGTVHGRWFYGTLVQQQQCDLVNYLDTGIDEGIVWMKRNRYVSS